MFEAQGSFEMQIKGQILQVDIKGCWDIATAFEYKYAIEKNHSAFNWSALSNVVNNE